MIESQYAAETGVSVPAAPREFRAVWVATVANIDWPSRPGLPSGAQKKEFVEILDRAKAINMNAVIFQVRPACDALYESSIEPWSPFLTGRMGQPPQPMYDPLAFAVEEAHKRGLELHAWFNPYRAQHSSAAAVSANHISKTHPEIVRKVGRFLWLDPGMKETRNYTISVILDVVRRYDVDGVHIDDYFYPYPEYLDGKPFPDSATYAAYKQGGGTLGVGDWRRQAVNEFVETMYTEVKKAKPWVKVGISPFGIWRTGYPSGVQGLDPYATLYADSKLWINKGWVDYWTPQLYWAINSNQPYKKLLGWWVEQNTQKRHVWPGLGLHRMTDSYKWQPDELINQVSATRIQSGATGNVFYSMKDFMRNTKKIDDALLSKVYNYGALVPPCPWLNPTTPPAPQVGVQRDPASGKATISFAGQGQAPFMWAVYTKQGTSWRLDVLPATHNSFVVATNAQGKEPDVVAISALDRTWNESPRMVVPLAAGQPAQ